MAKNIDPVCGMKVSDTSVSSTYNGKTYYFCCDHCKQTFDQNPIKYTR